MADEVKEPVVVDRETAIKTIMDGLKCERAVAERIVKAKERIENESAEMAHLTSSLEHLKSIKARAEALSVELAGESNIIQKCCEVLDEQNEELDEVTTNLTDAIDKIQDFLKKREKIAC